MFAVGPAAATAQGGLIDGTRDSLWAPPTCAARPGAPKRRLVRGWVPDGKKWSATCPGVLSGTRWVPPQRGVFWRHCSGISACLGQYITYIQHTCANIQYIQYRNMHICIQKNLKCINDTYNTYTYALSEHPGVLTACMCMYCNAYVYV